MRQQTNLVDQLSNHSVPVAIPVGRTVLSVWNDLNDVLEAHRVGDLLQQVDAESFEGFWTAACCIGRVLVPASFQHHVRRFLHAWQAHDNRYYSYTEQ